MLVKHHEGISLTRRLHGCTVKAAIMIIHSELGNGKLRKKAFGVEASC
jgi:hypothetical protein